MTATLNKGFTPRILLDRRVILAIFACFFLGSAIVFFSSSSNIRPTYDWLPKSSKTESAFSVPPKNENDPHVVELDYLTFRPKTSETVKFYWNIPYAASAGGENRFRAPQPVPKRYNGTMEWSGELGMCPRIQKIDPTQRNREDVAGPEISGLETKITEDCLSLNVFTPIDAEAGDDLPVVVNIPGGGFHLPGRANGGELVEKSRGKDDKGVIVVTLYYRNGIYGFLSGDEIEKDGDFNMGLKDQRAALEWVQKYIRYFGGNPDHVVIMGTSAGAASVLLQMAANEGDNYVNVPGTGRKRLFHGAIAQSPAAPTFYTREQANHFWKNVAEGVNCTDLSVECVRDSSVGDLYFENYPMSFPGRDSPPRWMWAPTAEKEGGMWTKPALSAIIEGKFTPIPAIIGFTSNEGSDQVKKATDNLGEFKSYLKDHYPLLTDADLDLLARNYPNDRHWPDSGRYWDAVAKAQGEIRYICPAYLSSNSMAEHNGNSDAAADVRTWQYHWDVVWGPDKDNGFGTKHAATVGKIMSKAPNWISDYFISFMKHLDPNVDRNGQTPYWDALDMSAPQRLFFTNRQDQSKVLVTLEDRDQERHRRCEDIRKMMPRTQQ
ncbi:alpha/beta-hydrolase [Corynespora cassiicola Philippines]|uniref:Carboxylic ester hydrolase n=1 Tax=Corynespora cassiicola Philippines TaxID=1448308 RepID=A0A2T2P423_CORCC|nr:alpha/beta-hydrolase [Corynespora cassiicola Philippines]